MFVIWASSVFFHSLYSKCEPMYHFGVLARGQPLVPITCSGADTLVVANGEDAIDGPCGETMSAESML